MLVKGEFRVLLLACCFEEVDDGVQKPQRNNRRFAYKMFQNIRGLENRRALKTRLGLKTDALPNVNFTEFSLHKRSTSTNVLQSGVKT